MTGVKSVNRNINGKQDYMNYSKPTPLYQLVASAITARNNCINSGNTEWKIKWENLLQSICVQCLPSGAGFDKGTRIDLEASSDEQLVFRTEFHHMNDIGYYDGWTAHAITVTGSLQFGINVQISGKDRNDIKEYIHEVFLSTLHTNTVYDSDMRALFAHYLNEKESTLLIGNNQQTENSYNGIQHNTNKPRTALA